MKEDLKENQPNQKKTHGGARVGAGRPKGSQDRPKITDDMTQEEKDNVFRIAYEAAIDGDQKLLQFFLEHLYGKARQNIGLGGEDGGNLVVKLIEYNNKEEVDGDNDSV